MPIYQLDPNAANRQQLQFFMSQIALFAMQRAQQKARLEEQERELAMTQQRIDLARSEEGWMKGKAPTEKKQVEMAGVKSPLAPEGGATVQQRPDVEAMESGGEQYWRYKQELKTMKLGDTGYVQPYVVRGNSIKLLGNPVAEKEQAMWSEPYKDEESGALLRRNLITNKVETVIGREPTTTEKVTWSKPYKDKDTGAMVQISSTGLIRAVPGSPSDSMAPQNYEQRVFTNWQRSFGAPTDAMGRIMTLQKPARRARLAGWLRVRKIEEGTKRFTPEQLDAQEEAIMTSLGIDLDVQQGLRGARMAGATSNQIIELIEKYAQEAQREMSEERKSLW